MNSPRVAVIGGGQMGRALLGGMLASGCVKAENARVVDHNDDSRMWWQEHHRDVGLAMKIDEVLATTDVFILAIKPYAILKAASELAGHDRLVISVAAGITLKQLQQSVQHGRLIRVMPNTPSLVGAGASGFCAGEAASAEDIQWTQDALSAVGLAVQVTETQLSAVTGLSGSGPAYICLVIEALADGGVLTGLPRPLAMQLAAQTVLGTAKMVMETGQHPGALKDAVASPGGTTIAALQVLEQHGLRGALIDAVQASAKRSLELS